MAIRRWIVLAAVAMALAACQGLIKPDPTLRAFYDAVHAGDMNRIRSLAAPELFTPEADAALAQLRQILPREAPSKITGLNRNYIAMVNAGETQDVVDIYEFKSFKGVVSGRLHRASKTQPWKVQGFHVRLLTARDLEVNAFTFSGKGPLHYAFFAAAIAAPLLMVAALVKVIRRKGLKRKWLWGILAFVGAVTLHLNWTTGVVTVKWLTVQLIGAGVTSAAAGGLAPWVASFTLPIGAILILTGVWANPARAKAAKMAPSTFD